MKLVDADFLRDLFISLKKKYLGEFTDKDRRDYICAELDLYCDIMASLPACSCPTYTVIEAESQNWIPCAERLPEAGVNVILTFNMP